MAEDRSPWWMVWNKAPWPLWLQDLQKRVKACVRAKAAAVPTLLEQHTLETHRRNTAHAGNTQKEHSTRGPAPTSSSVSFSPEHGLNRKLNSREGDGAKKQGLALSLLFIEINIRYFVIQRWQYNWVFQWSWKNLSLKAFQEFKI